MKQMEDDVSRLIQNFSRFSHFIKRRSRNADLRTGEIAILRCIMHHTDGPDGEIKPSQISALMGLQQPSITPSLRSLEERGYVRRRNSDQDRREVYFSVTEKTREMAAEERRRTAQMFAGLAEYLGEEDTRKLMEIMERVSGYLDQQIESSPKNNCSGRGRRGAHYRQSFGKCDRTRARRRDRRLLPAAPRTDGHRHQNHP